MMPVLFTIGTFHVYAFGFFLSIAFLLSTFLIWKLAKEEFKEEEYLDAYLYTCIVALFSARILYILLHAEEFGRNILTYIVVRETPGLSLFGGFLGGFLYIWWHSRKKKYSLFHVLDIFSIAAAFALFFAKIGQQLGGATFGKETQFFLAIAVAGRIGRFHPIELYEATLYLLLGTFLIYLYQKRKQPFFTEGLIFCLFVFLVAIFVFLLEFLKVYPVYLGVLSLRHIIALMLAIAIAKPLMIRLRRILDIRKGKTV